METCHNCGQKSAEFDCNGLKFCDLFCFKEWDREEREKLDRFAEEYRVFYPAKAYPTTGEDGNKEGSNQ